MLSMAVAIPFPVVSEHVIQVQIGNLDKANKWFELLALKVRALEEVIAQKAPSILKSLV